MRPLTAAQRRMLAALAAAGPLGDGTLRRLCGARYAATRAVLRRRGLVSGGPRRVGGRSATTASWLGREWLARAEDRERRAS